MKGWPSSLTASGLSTSIAGKMRGAHLYIGLLKTVTLILQAALIDANTIIEAEDNVAHTALHAAAGYGHESTVSLLLASGAHPNLLDRYGRTAMAGAARRGSVAIAKELLSNATNIDEQTDDGYATLADAAIEGRLAVIPLLLEAGAEMTA
ncbi:MAG: hypothetical protein ALECFALPRED_006122 [Alectoria fallacina]|uniref:Ankyrin repeat protein n=1 Tax=Alectoria fallacina TaxID=1903189 RepID=A0A8H3ET72_9LECA|nr:MAG: hypothetical protein ALECFALPRED_006122 [Alectoria fallacina]